MLWAPLRWLARNLSTLILAFILSVVVWVSAVVTVDPNEEHTFRPVTIELVGQDPNLLLIGDPPDQVRLTLKAPRSIWNQLNNTPSLVRAWVDLSGLGPGEHAVEVKTQVAISPFRYVRVDPQEIQLTLEPLVSRNFPLILIISGELPLGYRAGTPVIEPMEVVVSGPESAVSNVAEVRAALDISGAIDTFQSNIPVDVVDENGDTVPDVTVTPRVIAITQPVSLLGGFKNVVVKVVTTGQVANGYRLTNVSVSPPTVTLFSDNPQLVDEIPGFVETLPVDLTNLSDDQEINVGLDLPVGVTSVREPTVLVQVSVAAIEGSLTLSLPVEVIGLSSELEVSIAPSVVDVIVAGPLNVLDELTPDSFRVVLDLSGLPPGIYQRSPVVDRLPERVRVQTTLPETVEVSIVLAPTPTPTPTEVSTPEPSLTPGITPTGTPQP